MRHDRREMVVVVAMWAVDVAMMAVVVPMIVRVIMVAVGAMDMGRGGGLGRGSLAVGRAVGHAAFPVRGWVFRGIAELPPVPKGAKRPDSRWQRRLCDRQAIAFGPAIP